MLSTQLGVFKEVVGRACKRAVSELMLEFDTGGNVRFEEGRPGDVWFSSCADLVKSRVVSWKVALWVNAAVCLSLSLGFNMSESVNWRNGSLLILPIHLETPGCAPGNSSNRTYGCRAQFAYRKPLATHKYIPTSSRCFHGSHRSPQPERGHPPA